MKRTNTMLMTTVIISIALPSVFAFDFQNNEFTTTEIPFAAEAKKSTTHNITIEAVAMPDGLYAYRMVDYELVQDNNGDDDDENDDETTKLSNSGERLQLGKPGDIDEDGIQQYIRVDRVTYDDDSPWPITEPDGFGPDGDGESLTRIVLENYGNDPVNWQGQTPSPGS